MNNGPGCGYFNTYNATAGAVEISINKATTRAEARLNFVDAPSDNIIDASVNFKTTRKENPRERMAFVSIKQNYDKSYLFFLFITTKFINIYIIYILPNSVGPSHDKFFIVHRISVFHGSCFLEEWNAKNHTFMLKTKRHLYIRDIYIFRHSFQKT